MVLSMFTLWNLTLLYKALMIFFSQFLFLNWGIIALQCCVNFCYTTTWISHMYMYIFSLSSSLPLTPSHSSKSSQRQSWAPSAISSFLLFVSYMVVYICQYYSLNLPNPLLPILCPKVHSLCLHFSSCTADRFIIS